MTPTAYRGGRHCKRCGRNCCSALRSVARCTVISPTVLLWSLPLTAGYLLAIPFTVITAMPALGHLMRRHGFAGIPEDFAPPPEIAAVQVREGS